MMIVMADEWGSASLAHLGLLHAANNVFGVKHFEQVYTVFVLCNM